MSCKSIAIIQFAKPPVLGLVKTRIAESLGDERALQVHKQLCLHVNRQLVGFVESQPEGSVVLYLALSGIRELASKGFKEYWEDGLRWHASMIQHGEDLGKRMSAAIEDAGLFSSGVIIVGSDFPVLDNSYLKQAVNGLKTNDLILGPSDDGGYGLIGAGSKIQPRLESIEWGTEKVLEQTLASSRAQGLQVHCLDVRRDVDTEEDLQRWYDSNWSPSYKN